MDEAGYKVHVPTWRERIARKLGYRYHWVDLPEDVPTEGWMMTTVKMRFSFLDRVRLLFDGRLHLDLRQATDAKVDNCTTATSFEIGR